MSELSSSKNLPANNTGSSNINSSASTNANVNKNNDANRFSASQQTANENKQVKPAMGFIYQDVFNTTNPVSAGRLGGDLSQNPYAGPASQVDRSTGSRPLSFVPNTSAAYQQRLLESVNTVQTDIQNFINNFMSRFVDIMDKISAVFGEREKDIREKLSDSFKRVEVKIHEFFAPIDASFEQKDHHREKKTKDQEEQNKDEDRFIHTHRID